MFFGWKGVPFVDGYSVVSVKKTSFRFSTVPIYKSLYGSKTKTLVYIFTVYYISIINIYYIYYSIIIIYI